MSKKVVMKNKNTPAQPAPAEAPKVNGSSAGPAAAPQKDVRVAQQLRVLETVTSSKGETGDKTYSPRTESQIKKLSDILDFFQFSRADIASLVRRCNYDENQIQVAVANIIEDRANHEQEDWGTVKNKKQAKEEKKIKEEEDKKEQERLEKEAEKKRREEEKRAAKEAREAERAARKGKGAGKNGSSAEEAAGSGALPPDPAILFASSREPPAGPGKQGKSGKNEEKWWENGDDWNGKDWEWKDKSWSKDWDGQGDDWWGGEGEWEKAGSKKKGQKEKKDAAAKGQKGGKSSHEEEDSGEIWDMPDTSVALDAEAGLDQWTLGDLRAHERLVEGDSPPGVPKALPEGAMTLEELERGHLAAAEPEPAAVAMPPTAPPVSAPVPTAPPAAKPRVDGLPPPPQVDPLAVIGNSAAPAPEQYGDKGGDKGKGKGKGKAKGPEGEKERLDRIDRSDDPRRQAVEEVGDAVTVRKHSSMGCAVVSMSDIRVRQAIVAQGAEVLINGIKVQVKPHTNKETQEEVTTDIFVAWGRQVEKTTPLSERELTKFFDTKHQEIVASWKAADEEQARAAEEKERAARHLEEQARQEAQLRERAEQRRRYEEEMAVKRRQDEAETQRRMAEQQQGAMQQRQQQSVSMQQQQQQQQKWMTDQWMQQAGGMAAAQAQNRPAGAAADQSAAMASGYPQQSQPQQAQAAFQFGAAQQWMQAMAYHSQQGWQQQMAQRNMQQMQGMGAAGSGQEYDANALRAQAAAYYAYQEQLQRGQQTQAYAAQAQVQQQQQQGFQNPGAAYGNYGAAAAYARGERI